MKVTKAFFEIVSCPGPQTILGMTIIIQIRNLITRRKHIEALESQRTLVLEKIRAFIIESGQEPCHLCGAGAQDCTECINFSKFNFDPRRACETCGKGCNDL